MTPERLGRLRQLFEGVLRLPESERGAFLRRDCGADRELLEEIESLLAQSGGSSTTIKGLHVKNGATEELNACIRLKGRYLLQREIGRGGFGVVYLATDEELLGRRVVVKILHSAPPGSWARRKFRNEIEALARLNHPGIVSILDSGETDEGRPFLVMEYIEGAALRSLFRPEGMDLERVAEIVRQAGAALEAAHRSGVWHRDLKPENILIQTIEDGEQRVKLIDFGIATVERSEISDDSCSRVAGTFRYMAPEQLMGRPSAASDIYALGVVTYEMTTGRMPFPAETAVELHAMQKAGVQVRPRSLRPNIPEPAERSILRALQFTEGDRYRTVMDFLHELILGLRSTKAREPFARADRDPHIGRLVVKMCDRRSQVDEFRAFLACSMVRHPGRTVFCLIHGDEGECHESLIERLAYNVELLHFKRHGDDGPSVKIVKVPWQYEGPVEVRMNRLIAWLFERFGTGNALRLDDTSPAALGALLASACAGFVFVQHDVRAARWDDQIRSLIQAYREYLAKMPQAVRMPQIVVCLSVIYPSDSAPEGHRLMWSPKAFARKMLKARARRDLADIARGSGDAQSPVICDCMLLDELKPITRDDVLEWFSLHNILETEEQRLSAAQKIFTSTGSSAAKRMAEIETHLREVQHTFLLERGFI